MTNKPEPSPDAFTLAKQLRSKATEITSEPFMVAVWDAIASYYIEKGATDCGSWPRDVFESHMASLAEELEGAADFIAAPRSGGVTALP